MDYEKIPLKYRVAGLLLTGIAIIIGVDFMTEQLPVDSREYKDNNLFGVTGSNVDRYPGIVSTDPPLFVFKDLQSGINAGFNLLLDFYFNKNGWNTLNKIGYHWSGDPTGGDNKTGDYAANLAAFSGLDPSQELSYWKNGIAIMDAISKAENGAGVQIAFTRLATGLLAGGTM